MTELTLHGVSVSLGRGDARTPVLRAVDATCAPGVLTALVGPSGSGKSTLLAVAGALLRPDEGRVLLGGTDLAALTDAERARVRRERVGYVFQSGNLLGGLTAVEQLLAAASVAGRPARRLRAAAESALAEVGLAHRLHHRADRLSGGERQRTALARALFLEPDLLLIDEPTAAVDRTQAAALTALIATTAKQRGCATLVATHDPVVAEAAGATIAR
ncbi:MULTISPECIES: ATP-binding cassette domain-containing protein [Kitasatospora]|uniref:Putative ABC transporter ATP-binding protein n=1 Tax=Kitasatospora setae (strain ATCC 33774 / DSM 43861 / JCM 3304 / KCC A-0304 / NBRC 14216 / KM-6054) TaxID=452652 RepID=E4N718_KITSK|nr:MULTISPECIES: ATP-binding cassette domain-containing protein [Kitasatospora]BAJ26999.1 putative ABC transporter ATP-binding protein [Kitasatospora setae KM-6054]